MRSDARKRMQGEQDPHTDYGDRWLHHDPAVRELIRAAQEKAWQDGWDARARYVGTNGNHYPGRNPYRAAS